MVLFCKIDGMLAHVLKMWTFTGALEKKVKETFFNFWVYFFLSFIYYSIIKTKGRLKINITSLKDSVHQEVTIIDNEQMLNERGRWPLNFREKWDFCTAEVKPNNIIGKFFHTFLVVVYVHLFFLNFIKV